MQMASWVHFSGEVRARKHRHPAEADMTDPQLVTSTVYTAPPASYGYARPRAEREEEQLHTTQEDQVQLEAAVEEIEGA